MANKVSFSGQNLPLTSIAAYYNDCERSLRLYFSDKNPEYSLRFNGYTRSEVEEELKLRLQELDRAISLSVLSALEALFRVDYLTRCYNKKKDHLSRKMRDVYGKKGVRASLENDILQLWKENYPEYKSFISEVITALSYRNWLAHGRYWEPKLGKNYDYQSLYDLAYSIEELLSSSLT
ncbi:MAG: hypothetical protein VKJ02_16010 [Snowella sp.]|nr:hypothetical protein [Snowella sp.]